MPYVRLSGYLRSLFPGKQHNGVLWCSSSSGGTQLVPELDGMDVITQYVDRIIRGNGVVDRHDCITVGGK